MKIKVLLIDDNQLLIELLRSRFGQTSEIEVVGESHNDTNFLDAIKIAKPDIILMEVGIPQMNSTVISALIYKHFPSIKVIVLTARFEKQHIKTMMEANSWGYLLKNCTFEQLRECIIQVNDGKKHLSTEIQNSIIEDYLERKSFSTSVLTKREIEILRLLAEGKSVRAIADALFISIKTAGTHKQNIFDKMHFENMAQLIKYAIKNDIV